MPRKRANAAVRVDMDLRSVEAAAGEVDALMQAMNGVTVDVSRVVFNEFKNLFVRSVDTNAQMEAMVDPKGQGRFHHLYEPQEVGNPAARLFDLIVPQAVRDRRGTGELYARIDYFASTETEKPWGIVRTGNMLGRYQKSRAVPFRNKAQILEEGQPVTVPAGSTYAVDAGGRAKGLSLITTQYDSQHSTANAATHNALLNYFNMFVSGGLGNSAIVAAMGKINKAALETVVKKLYHEMLKVDRMYAAGATSGGSRQIFRGKISSLVGSRNHITQKNVNEYKNFMRERMRSLLLDADLDADKLQGELDVG